jgi:hypothetical protein
MRKFIISDVHGFGKLYYSIMNYLDKISNEEEVELYINGDLIDRGNETVDILLDVIKIIKENKPNFKIEYLGGNHELMMHDVYKRRLNGKGDLPYPSWFMPVNGGLKTDKKLEEVFKDNKDGLQEVAEFISNLKIYHKFEEKINGKEIVLVHAASPSNVKDECDLHIKDNHIRYYVWAREDYLPYPFKLRIGNKNYFTIIGHTPNDYIFGYKYDKDNNILNIDGGVAYYVQGEKRFNHFPLVEVCDGYLNILTFDSNGKINYGHYFDGNYSTPYSEDEYIKIRKLI